MSIPKTLGLAFAFCILYACEKVDVDTEDNTTDVASVRPTSLGEGTQSSPYTVPQVLAGEMDGKLHWYIGYVVGSTYTSMENAIFEDETTNKSNILISANKYCESADEAVPVDLKTATLQKKFSLVYNPQRFRQCIILKGRFGKYFRRNGIREIAEAYWLPDIDLDNLDPTVLDPSPTEWNEQDIQY